MFASFSNAVQQFFAAMLSFIKMIDNVGQAGVSVTNVALVNAQIYEAESKADLEKKMLQLTREVNAAAKIK